MEAGIICFATCRSFRSTSRLRLLMRGFAYASATSLVPQSVKRVRLTFSVTPSFLRGYWNIHQLSIDYACLPHLRSRLTQGGRTFPWKPWVFDGQDSHLSFRYSHRHSHFQPVQPSSRSTFIPVGTLPYRFIKDKTRSFGNMLSPGTFSAQDHSTSELLRTL